MAINPVNIPSAAGLDYGSGDVRHFSPGDAVDVPGLQNPTRYLAQRDNDIAETLNQVVEVVNNTEQFVPLPVVRTILAPSESVTVINYRIPVGFESRILDAAIGCTPASPSIELDIYYSQGTYGNTTGESVVSTANEFTGGTTFYQAGEFIVVINNKSDGVLELAASVLLTLRPVGGVGSLLAASVVEGPPGPPGGTGPPGIQGPPGSGGAGTPGMIWSGSYQFGQTYRDKQVVSFNLYGSLLSSFIALTTTTEDPQTSYLTNDGVWAPVALGSTGPRGATGATGASGSNANIPNYFTQVVYGTLTTGADWVSLPINGYSSLILTAGTTVNTVPLLETYINSASANVGFLSSVEMLSGVLRLAFTGHGTFTLPKAAYGAQIDYSNNFVAMIASVHGTVPNITVSGSGSIPVIFVGTNGFGQLFVPQTNIDVGAVGNASLITVIPSGTDKFVINNLNPSPLFTQFVINGFDAN